MGSKEDQFLTPEKLALFYKVVGGNYDCKFLVFSFGFGFGSRRLPCLSAIN